MTNPTSTGILEFSTNDTSLDFKAKRAKHHHILESKAEEEAEAEAEAVENQNLLPGLPDHIAQLCLSLVPPSVLYSVCRSWRRLIYTPSFQPFLSLYGLFESTEIQSHLSNSLQFCSFDPISGKWQHLPPPPPPLGRQFGFLLRHPSFISRKLPIQSVAVSGNLVLVAATVDQFQPALSKPILFDPLSGKWSHGPSLSAPRRWCAAGASRASVFVASGIGSHYNTDVARSVEKWDLNIPHQKQQQVQQPRRQHQWKWEKMGNLKDGKFSRDAIDAVGWKGKLCMVNVKGDAAKEGTIYDVEKDSWEEMPEGMIAGWRGPAAAMEEETIYVVDESKGSLKKYDHSRDAWVEIVENELLKGAIQLVAAKGKVCVLRADCISIVVVDVGTPPPARLWVVDAPPGLQGVAIHALPRPRHPEILYK